MSYNRVLIPGDAERPISIESFIANGVPGGNFTAIISYDELYAYIRETGKAIQPFITEGISSKLKDDDLVVLRVKAKDLRFIAQVMKGIEFP